MSREIKFRAWDGIRMTTSGIMFNTSTGCLIVPDSRYILMQYTGLKDKNRVEIYEGDIVRLHDGLHTCISKVIWRKDLGCFEFDETKYSPDIFPFPMNKKCMKIIGNIYQNPELLKGGEER